MCVSVYFCECVSMCVSVSLCVSMCMCMSVCVWCVVVCLLFCQEAFYYSLNMHLFRVFIPSWFNFGDLDECRNLFVSFRFSNIMKYRYLKFYFITF